MDSSLEKWNYVCTLKIRADLVTFSAVLTLSAKVKLFFDKENNVLSKIHFDSFMNYFD